MKRLASLDGLRGLAALVVVLHHTLLTFPDLAAAYLGDGLAGGWAYWAAYSPLHAVWEGQTAVYVFFVLSGLVLTLPVAHRGRDFDWRAYYPQRLARLYLPVWAALVLGIVWLLVVPRTDDMASLWLQQRSVDIEPWRIFSDVTLVAGHGGLVSPLWSLQWEILFSLLLPAFAFVGARMRRLRWGVLALSIVASGTGAATHVQALQFLPMFLVGVVFATVLPDIQAYGERMRRWQRIALTALAPLLLITPWLVRPLRLHGLTGVLEAACVIGAAAAVLAALTVPFVQRLLTGRTLRWFGRISFSLYLVHEPVIISFAFLFGEGRELLAATCSIPASIVLAWLFFRVIEVPSHRFARRLGSLSQRRHRAPSLPR